MPVSNLQGIAKGAITSLKTCFDAAFLPGQGLSCSSFFFLASLSSNNLSPSGLWEFGKQDKGVNDGGVAVYRRDGLSLIFTI